MRLMSKGIHWIRNDLRLSDNPALSKALSECEEVLLVYTFDNRTWQSGRMGPYRAKFILQSLHSLGLRTKSLGGALTFVHGQASKEIPKLMRSWGAERCYAQREDAWEETEEEKALSRQIDLRLTEGKGLLAEEDLPFCLRDMPGVFSPFRRKVEKNLTIRPELPLPSNINCSWESEEKLPDLSCFGCEDPKLDSRAVLDFRGGETEAENWMREWIWERDCLKTYKETRNGLLGSDYSSKLSPWLSTGCLSAVRTYWEIKRFEQDRGANESTYWLFFELLWREFFRFVARSHGSKIFLRGGIRSAESTRRRGDPRTLEKWKNGRTPDEFVNANMIELARTGWMSNRGRQNVASYLIHDLGQDWLAGARHFEELLIDYDPCSNYGNWMYLGGVGNDPRPNRAFNLVKQAQHYDPDQSFRKHWLG